MEEDRVVAERLLAEDARAKELRRKVRKDWRLGLVSPFFAVASIGFGFTQLGIVIRSWSHPESAPFPLTGQFFAQGYHAVQGRLSPETALTLVLAAVGVCATINVALFVESLATSRRAQVELSEGRRILEVAAMLMAVGALATGVVVWANVNSPSAIGTAIGTSLFAIVTALLSTSARRQVQSADRAHGYNLAVTNLAKLNGWKRELAARGVPRPLGGIPTVVPSKTLWAKYVRGALLRLAVLAGFMVLVLGVLLVIFAVTQRITTGSVNLPALVIAAFLAAAAYTGMMAGVSIGWFTARRYTDPYSTNRVRFHLDIRPRLTRAGYCVAVGALLVLAFVHGPIVSAVYATTWLLPAQALCWLALRYSRTRPHIRWSRWMTEPLWGIVELMLQGRRVRQERERDRLLQDEKDAVAA